MKAIVFSVFKNYKHRLSYLYHSPKKFHDDVDTCEKGYFYPPMMRVRLLKESIDIPGRLFLDGEIFDTFASPEIIEKYTGFKIFHTDYSYLFEGNEQLIEFKWVEKEYPYMTKTYHYMDYITNKRIKMMEILSIETVYDVQDYML